MNTRSKNDLWNNANGHIIWKENQNSPFSIRFLEQDFYHDVFTFVTSPVIIYFALLTPIIIKIYQNEQIIFAILLFIIYTIYPFLHEYIRFRINQKTEYAITDSHVLFKFFNGINYSTHMIPIKSISKIHTIREEDNFETIMFITNVELKFNTYDTRTGNKRDWPTFEYIQNHLELKLLLKDLIKENESNKISYHPNLASKKSIGIFKSILLSITCIMFVNIFDFYLLPKNIIQDVALSSYKKLYEYRNSKTYTELGGKYFTQNGHTINTKYYYPELTGSPITIYLSPIFSNITHLYSVKKNYTPFLTSSFHQIIYLTAFLFFLSINIYGLFQLNYSGSLTLETFEVLVFRSIGGFIILALAWRLFN